MRSVTLQRQRLQHGREEPLVAKRDLQQFHPWRQPLQRTVVLFSYCTLLSKHLISSSGLLLVRNIDQDSTMEGRPRKCGFC